MSSNLLLSSNHEDEEFIDMEVSSSSSSPSNTTEFEFQKDGGGSMNNASPADELFYKGKLLPLHLPPRVQMVKTLLQNGKEEQEEFITFSTPMVQSCNISPSESCRVSTELTPDEYFFDWSTELTGFIGDHHHTHPQKYYSPWPKKLRLTQKLKASRNYLKSLFNKSTCGSDAKQPVIEQDSDKHFLTKYLKVNKKTSFGQKSKYPTLGNVLKDIEDQENEDSFVSSCSNRKSFSGAINRKCSPSSTSSSSSGSSSSSSSSSSFNYSNGIYELCKRNSSADSELEGSIEAAIDHCKKSQQVLNQSVFFPNSVL